MEFLLVSNSIGLYTFQRQVRQQATEKGDLYFLFKFVTRLYNLFIMAQSVLDMDISKRKKAEEKISGV